PVCQFGGYLGTIKRSSRSGLDSCFNLPKIFACQIQIRYTILLVAKSEYKFPVSSLYLSDDVDRLTAKVSIRLLQKFFGDLDISTRIINVEISKERLTISDS